MASKTATVSKKCTSCNGAFTANAKFTKCKKCHFRKKNKQYINHNEHIYCTICRKFFYGNLQHGAICNNCSDATHSNVACVVCDKEFISHNSGTVKKCLDCERDKKEKCSDCKIVFRKISERLSTLKCIDCKYKNIACEICGNKHSTTFGGPRKCNDCQNALNVTYNNHAIKITYDMNVHRNSCDSSCGKKNKKKRSDEYYAAVYSGSIDGSDSGEDDSDDETEVITKQYKLTKRITQSDIDSYTGEVNLNCAFLSLYELSSDWKDCGCMKCFDITKAEVYKKEMINLNDD